MDGHVVDVVPGRSPRSWLTTAMPSAFQATVLPLTDTDALELTRMPAPQPHVVKPQPFSHTVVAADRRCRC